MKASFWDRMRARWKGFVCRLFGHVWSEWGSNSYCDRCAVDWKRWVAKRRRP